MNLLLCLTYDWNVKPCTYGDSGTCEEHSQIEYDGLPCCANITIVEKNKQAKTLFGCYSRFLASNQPQVSEGDVTVYYTCTDFFI